MIHQNLSTLRKLMLLKGVTGGSKAIEATATGNPLTFQTDLARPLKSLLIPFMPQQEGTGDPSPENIRSIIPWNGLSVFGGGKNYASDISNRGNMQNTNGVWSNSNTDSKTYLQVVIQFFNGSTYIKNSAGKSINQSGMQTITFNIDVPNCNLIVFKHSGSQRDLSLHFPFSGEQGEYTISFNVLSANPNEVGGFQISAIEMVKETSTDTDIVFPSPVYGGQHEAVSGALSGTWGAKKVKDIEWTYNAQNTRFVGTIEDIKLYPAVRTTPFYASVFVSVDDGRGILSVPNNAVYGGNNSTTIYVKCEDYTDPEDFVTAYGEQVICYPLENPQEQTLTGHQLTALVGDNTIWSDADGSMTAVFLKKK